MLNEVKMQSIIDEFDLSLDELHMIAADLRYDLRKAMEGEENASLSHLKSYIGLPTGQEKGQYLALDFGGTNLRAHLISLKGNGQAEILASVSKPLRFEGLYDFVSADTNPDDLFDFMAATIDEVIKGDRSQQYLLGYTFSFATTQTDIYNARLLKWAKEIAVKGVEGKVINDLLKAALARQGMTNVVPNSIINDTTAALLSAAYHYTNVNIAVIYATGFNICYLEKYPGKAEQATIVNLEAGGFTKLITNHLDKQLDEKSEKPDSYFLEKMLSGRYMGELLGLGLQEAMNLPEQPAFNSVDISYILDDALADGEAIAKMVASRINQPVTPAEAVSIKKLAQIIAARSARLVAAAMIGVLWQIQSENKPGLQQIAIDGPLYSKVPGVKAIMDTTLQQLLSYGDEEDEKFGNITDKAEQVEIVQESGGSAMGAAIAAAVASK